MPDSMKPNNDNPVDEAIVRFIGRHHVLTLATSDSEGLWCSNLFYAYDKADGRFVFASDDDTRHGRQMRENPRIAASIVLETRLVGKVQGLQIAGTVEPAGETARAVYLKRFPYASVMELRLWQLRPDLLKLTDNTLGFGKKRIWKRL